MSIRIWKKENMTRTSPHCDRDAEVHRIQCGWLSRVTFISKSAILSIGHVWKTMSLKVVDKNWFFLRNLLELTNSRLVCTLFILKHFKYKKDFFFLNTNWPFAEVGSRRLHFFQFRIASFLINAIWFVKIHFICSSRKDGYYKQ